MGNLPHCHEQRFAQGETIIHQGVRGDRTFVIRAGQVLICKQGDDEDEVVPIESLGPGDLFGEMYLATNDLLRTATVVAVNEVTVDVFFEEQILRDLDNMSPLQKMMFLGLNRRLQKTTDNLVRKAHATEAGGRSAPQVLARKLKAQETEPERSL